MRCWPCGDRNRSLPVKGHHDAASVRLVISKWCGRSESATTLYTGWTFPFPPSFAPRIITSFVTGSWRFFRVSRSTLGRFSRHDTSESMSAKSIAAPLRVPTTDRLLACSITVRPPFRRCHREADTWAVTNGRLVGHARVSAEDQATASQRADPSRPAMRRSTTGRVRARPELARLVKNLRGGDVPVVVRIDRLARSVSHLLAVIEGLLGRRSPSRSLRDPIDTSAPQGMFLLQVRGAVAELLDRAVRAGLGPTGSVGTAMLAQDSCRCLRFGLFTMRGTGSPNPRPHRLRRIRALVRGRRHCTSSTYGR